MVWLKLFNGTAGALARRREMPLIKTCTLTWVNS
jgi:hypothetical protein